MKNYLLTILTFLCFKLSTGQSINLDVISELNVETVEKISYITAKVSNRTDLYLNLKFNFSILVLNENSKSLKQSLEEFLSTEESKNKTLEDFLKEHEENKYASKDFKEEFFSLNPFETRDLYKLSLEINTDEKIIVLFVVFDDDNNLISQSRVVLNDKKKSEVNASTGAYKGFQLTGLVVEDTKTKSGKDFYDRFFFYYNFNNINGNEVVKINEMFSFRRTTRIIVSVGDEVIQEFFAYPKEDYIEEMAKLSVQRVYRYFENKKKQKSYISHN